MDDDKIKEFCNITGAGVQVAEQLLQVCNGNLEMAINMHMEGQLNHKVTFLSFLQKRCSK